MENEEQKNNNKEETTSQTPTEESEAIEQPIPEPEKERQQEIKELKAFNPRRSFRHEKEKEQPEFDQKLLDITRTARMVAGGRRFSFRAVVVIGNKKGKVGVGTAKGADVTLAVEKAVKQAKKNLIEVPITDTGSISYMIEAKFGAAKVMIKPAAEGHGIIAGGTIRTVCDLAGIKNVTAKAIGKTSNKLNNARAAILALEKLQ